MTPDLRPARAGDLAALTALYNHYVGVGGVTFDTRPFGAEERRAWLAQFGATGRYRLWVAEVSGALLGYAGTLRFRDKPAYETSAESTIYLRPDACGQGLGARLYEALFASVAGEDLHRVYAGITLPNAVSVRLHERFGFRQAGLFREVGRKAGRFWDVAWYEKELG